MHSNSENRADESEVGREGYGHAFYFCVAACVLAFCEDLIRRLLGGGHAWVLLSKLAVIAPVVLLPLGDVEKSRLAQNYKLFVLVSCAALMHLFDSQQWLRVGVWMFSTVGIPIVCLNAAARLTDQEYRNLCILVVLLGLCVCATVFVAHVTGLYAVPGSLLGPLREGGGFRFYEMERLYFNAGVFLSAERVAWVCTCGVAIGGVLAMTASTRWQMIGWLFSATVFVGAAALTSRVTGFVLCGLTFLFVLGHACRTNTSGVVLALLLGVVAWNMDFTTSAKSIFEAHYSYYKSRVPEMNDRIGAHEENVLKAVLETPMWGYGPVPQGSQYLADWSTAYPQFRTEGLVSHSVYQFGVMALFHCAFHVWLVGIAIRMLWSRSPRILPIAFLLLVTRVWILKASQMETDTLAQFLVFLLTAPVLLRPRNPE